VLVNSRPSRRFAALGSVLVTLVGVLVALTVAPAPAAAATPTPVLETKIIGYSVQHRAIRAYHLGNPRVARPVVLIGEMHGDEKAGVKVAVALIHGTQSVENVNLWIIPTINPDGYAAGTRQNAHKVDLNRNFPYYWAHLTGQYYSGTGPLSEPESRAVYNFLRTVRPRYVTSLHQPLYGVDTTDGGQKDPGFRDRLASNLHLPLKAFRCWSFCHGSMSGWYTRSGYGVAITAEFGWTPSSTYLTTTARRGVVVAMGGTFGSLAAHNPKSALGVRASSRSARVYGWSFDYDNKAAHVVIDYYRDGTLLRRTVASAPSATISQAYALPGSHGYSWDIAATAGSHTFCMVFHNIGAGTGSPRQCVTTTVPA
jgi:protein MpaA